MRDKIYSKYPIFFYWDGPISPTRLQILKDCVYSTRVFNPNRNIYVISNTLSHDVFDQNYEIETRSWSTEIFENLPVSSEYFTRYVHSHPRNFSDVFRLVLLWKYGGSYIDTDDVAIKPMSDKPNIVCRSYDPHTSFYNKIEHDQCVPGTLREIRGYDHINMFPRNDCWQNWEAESDFITDLLSNEKFLNKDDTISILGNFSWQSLTNETCIKKADMHGKKWNYGLTLLYLFEDFVASSSYWDRCMYGGEMCDAWNKLKDVTDYDWGSYKTDKKTAMDFYSEVCDRYPMLSHLWLHSKDMNDEWLLNELDDNKKYALSTWLYFDAKEKIQCFR